MGRHFSSRNNTRNHWKQYVNAYNKSYGIDEDDNSRCYFDKWLSMRAFKCNAIAMQKNTRLYKNILNCSGVFFFFSHCFQLDRVRTRICMHTSKKCLSCSLAWQLSATIGKLRGNAKLFFFSLCKRHWEKNITKYKENMRETCVPTNHTTKWTRSTHDFLHWIL